MASDNKAKAKSKAKVQPQTPKKHSSGGKIAIFAFLGILVVAVIIGVSVLWEKKLESLVGVDLPDEAQETSEVSSLVPYICDQDPENCKTTPLIFRGTDVEGKADISSPSEDETNSSDLSTVPSDEEHSVSSEGVVHSLEFMSALKGLEEKLDVVGEVINEFDSLRNEVEILRLLMLIQSVKDGAAPFDFITQSLSSSPNAIQKKLVEQLPQGGRIVPFTQIPLQTLQQYFSPQKQVQKGDNFDFRALWEDSLSWLKTVVQIKTPTEVEEESKAIAFREAAISGQYSYAVSLYQDMDESQQYVYALWFKQIEELALLELIRLNLLQQLQKGV